METNRVDGLLVMHPSNNLNYAIGADSLWSYISCLVPGFVFPLSAIFPKGEEPVVLCADWGVETLRQETWIHDIRGVKSWIYFEKRAQLVRESEKIDSKPEQFDLFSVLADALRDKGLLKGRLGVELDTLPVSTYQRIKGAVPAAEIVDVSTPPMSSSTLWWQMRMMKSEDEIDKLRTSAEIAEAGIKVAVDVASEALEKDVTELDVFRAYNRAVIDLDGIPRLGTWGTGERSGGAHLSPSSRVLKEGDILRLDCGAIYKGYSADICRTFVVGKPTEHASKLYNALQVAQRKVREAMKPGVKFSDLFLIGQSTVRELGFPQYSRGHLGHSIGLGGEEPPLVSAQENLALQPGMVLAAELSYYVIGAYGMNIEDNVLVTENGVENLSKLPRELVSVPTRK